MTPPPWSRRQAVAVTLSALAPAAWPQAATLHLLTGFPTGIVDQVARLLAETMGPDLGRHAVVEARPGAAGRLAVEALLAARPDGDTLLVVPHGPMTLFEHVFRNLRYDPVRQFVPLSQLATFDFALGAAPMVPAQRLQDLPSWVRGRSEVTGFCSPGVGTVPHFLGERYAASAGLQLTHVAFKSPAEMLPAVMGNQVPLVFLPLGDLLQAARADRLRILATTGSARSPQSPEVPTFLESGVDLQMTGWIGLYAPAGVPPARLAQIEAAAMAAMRMPRVHSALQAINLSARGSTGAELARVQASESLVWAEVVRRSGFKPE
ncbi:tripartite tricarboxylate transporter substrate-binding protein [Pseudorhodoferax sp.]|uniref:tripartite tricarboxylate transporter substrate-binding protein n=1 Tax=Pseudorhodoferax sp. TaxID=1993553 RepID=UPI002DD653E5|nr:tripartite tricarboxylate transporter substrate-binding protein [Pseudorhodoferax sp.]